MWSDAASEEDFLNFGEVSQLAVDILTTPEMFPVSLGIFGSWGAGKSSLLRLIEKDLEKNEKKLLIVRFDAWLYQGYDDVRASLLEMIARQLSKASEEKSIVSKTKSLLSRVDVFRAFGLLAEGIALAHGVPTGGLLASGLGAIKNLFNNRDKAEFSETDYKNLTETATDAKNQLSELIKPKMSFSPSQEINEFRKEYEEILNEIKKPLIVIIDNLDRCSPRNAIFTLEAIRLFLFLPNTAFIIAADEKMIRDAVAEYFKEASPQHQIDYLDKLIQIPIRVPKAGVREIRSYLFMLFAIANKVKKEDLEKLRGQLEKSLQEAWKEEPISKEDILNLIDNPSEDLKNNFDLADKIAPILAHSPLIHGNPRTVKRQLNVIKMRSKIAKLRKILLSETIIAKLVIFERCAGPSATADLYRHIDANSGKPNIFAELEKPDVVDFPSDAPSSWSDNPTTKNFILEWCKLEPLLNGIDLRAAVYLSRETMPIGSYFTGLSPIGQEALQVLLATVNVSSPPANEVIKKLPMDEHIIVMQKIIDTLIQEIDWNKKPIGFSGAFLLAKSSPSVARLLKHFINNKIPSPHPPWLNVMLKDEIWYK